MHVCVRYHIISYILLYVLMYAVMYLCQLTAQAVTFYLMYLYYVDLLRSLYYIVILLKKKHKCTALPCRYVARD